MVKQSNQRLREPTKKEKIRRSLEFSKSSELAQKYVVPGTLLVLGLAAFLLVLYLVSKTS
jgi:hypothetical protein